MATGLVLSSLMYTILSGMKEGIDSLTETGQVEGRQVDRRTLLVLYKECVALETALTSTAYLSEASLESHMTHINTNISKFKAISQSLGNVEKLAILQVNRLELSGAISTIESIHQKVSTEDSIDTYKARFSELQNFFQSLENVLERVIPY